VKTVTVSEKGQVVIPIALRRQYGIEPGDRLEVIPEAQGFRLVVESDRKARSARECLGLAGYSGPRLSLEDLDPASLSKP
jgi:AbrB family looped-hinge helix DNA binding protein